MPACFNYRSLVSRLLFQRQYVLYLSFSILTLNAIGQGNEKNPVAFLRLNEVNSRASRHFLNHFSQATSVRWVRDKNFYIAGFETASTRSRVYYRSNGNFAFCLKNYLADGLNPDLKTAILRKFPGCQITMVTELTEQDNKAFFVNIKSGAYIKTLLCNDDGIEEMENIINAGI